LGEETYFYASGRPCSLDAQVFGQVAVILYSPYIEIRKILDNFPKLKKFIENIKNNYLSEPLLTIKFPDKTEHSKRVKMRVELQRSRNNKVSYPINVMQSIFL